MSRRRFGLLLIAALVVILGASYLSTQRNLPHDADGGSLLPSLGGELSSVTAIVIRKGGATQVTVHKTGEHWSVSERGDYPADVAKLRKALLALRDAKIIEEKTSDPARYAAIGVEDPTQPTSTNSEITVLGPGYEHSVIVGKAMGDGNFVRRDREKRSFTVEPAISFETEPRSWIDARLIDIPVALIQSLEIKPASGAAYTLRRPRAGDDTFSLEGVPAGRQALDAPALAPPPTTLGSLTAEDVAPLTDIDFSHPSQAIVTLTDGNVLTVTGAVIADKHWIQVTSSKDAVLAAKTQARAFEVASYRYDAIFKPLEQLLIQKEQPISKAAANPRARASPVAQGRQLSLPAAPVRAPTP